MPGTVDIGTRIGCPYRLAGDRLVIEYDGKRIELRRMK